MDTVIIGGGIVGLACARALSLAGHKTLLLEAENALSTKASGRNSQVIHAGMYYPTGSLKAKLCVKGAEMLYAYCAEKSIKTNKLSKYIVADKESELSELERWQKQGEANGVSGLHIISGTDAKKDEPNLKCMAALVSPSEGVFDANAYVKALAQDITDAGGCIATGFSVSKITGNYQIHSTRGDIVAAKHIVNAGGFFAQKLAALFEGARAIPETYFAKGNYFRLKGTQPFSRLIYPLPNEAGLGTHLTLSLTGDTWFGPDVEWVDSPENLHVDTSRKQTFVRDIKQYYPTLDATALEPFFAGIRAKIVGPGQAPADFLIHDKNDHGLENVAMLYGIESPGLTSNLALAEEVADRLCDTGGNAGLRRAQ